MSSIVGSIGVVTKGLKATFVKAFNNAEDPSDILPFIMDTSSDGRDEEYGWLGQSPSLTEWVDERKIKSVNEFDYQIVNKDYEATLGVARNDIEDDRLGNVKVRIQDLARKARIHPRKIFFELIEAGEVDLCYDGQPFFSNSHVEGASGVQSNLNTGTGTSLAQIKTDIDQAEADMLSFKDDSGEPYNEGAVKLGIICHPQLKRAFEELNTQVQINSSSNSMKGRISQITYSSRLSDVNDWYLSDISEGMKPIIRQNRKNPEFISQEGDSNEGFMRKKYLYGIDYRMGMGYGLWQKMIKVTNT